MFKISNVDSQTETISEFIAYADKLMHLSVDCIVFDHSYILEEYKRGHWDKIDFIFDKKLNCYFVNVSYHERLLSYLYNFHNKLPVDNYTPSLYLYNKMGFMKSSVSPQIFCREDYMFPSELFLISHLTVATHDLY